MPALAENNIANKKLEIVNLSELNTQALGALIRSQLNIKNIQFKTRVEKIKDRTLNKTEIFNFCKCVTKPEFDVKFPFAVILLLPLQNRHFRPS